MIFFKFEKPLNIVAFFFLILITLSCEKSNNSFEVEINLSTTHLIESDSLFLTDKITDFIPFSNGYVLAEENRSTLLMVDNSFKPIKRIGQNGHGPEEFDLLGSIETFKSGFVIHDKGHFRAVIIDSDGNITKSISPNILAYNLYNINVFRDSLLVFAIPDADSPIVTIDVSNEIISQFDHTVVSAKNVNQKIMRNQAHIKNNENNFFYFPPTETTIEVLDENFNLIQILDFSHLEFLQNSMQRSDEIYLTSNNKKIDYYSDVYQDGNNFYLLFYTDFYDQEDSRYKRNLNTVLKLSFDFKNQKLSIESIIKLLGNGYYKQLVVKDDRLYAFDLTKFTIDEYDLR